MPTGSRLTCCAADEAYRIGPPPSAESYLRADVLVETALRAGCDAIHPGYGFLAERAHFAAAVEQAGLAFIGPSAEAITAMGDKTEARRRMIAAGVPVVPGTAEPLAGRGARGRRRPARSASPCCSRPPPAGAGRGCGWSARRRSCPAPSRPRFGGVEDVSEHSERRRLTPQRECQPRFRVALLVLALRSIELNDGAERLVEGVENAWLRRREPKRRIRPDGSAFASPSDEMRNRPWQLAVGNDNAVGGDRDTRRQRSSGSPLSSTRVARVTTLGVDDARWRCGVHDNQAIASNRDRDGTLGTHHNPGTAAMRWCCVRARSCVLTTDPCARWPRKW